MGQVETGGPLVPEVDEEGRKSEFDTSVTAFRSQSVV